MYTAIWWNMECWVVQCTVIPISSLQYIIYQFVFLKLLIEIWYLLLQFHSNEQPHKNNVWPHRKMFTVISCADTLRLAALIFWYCRSHMVDKRNSSTVIEFPPVRLVLKLPWQMIGSWHHAVVKMKQKASKWPMNDRTFISRFDVVTRWPSG